MKSQLVVLCSVNIGETINKVEGLSNILEVCFDSGEKKILLSIINSTDKATVRLRTICKASNNVLY